MKALVFFLIAFAACLSISRAAISNQPIQNSLLTANDLQTIGIDQHLGATVPAGLTFTNSDGASINFDQLLARKPTVLALVYFDCPNLCTLVLNSTIMSLSDLRRDVGDGFQVVVVSIDPTETPALAAAKKTTYLRRYARGSNQNEEWHFLTGDQANISQLAAAVGYRYRYDPALHQFAHGSGIMVLDSQRRLVKYLLGIEYPPAQLGDAIVLAQKGETGSPVTNFLLLCYCYNPLTGPYGFLVFTVLKIAAAATVLGLAAFIFLQLRRDHQREVAP